MAFSGIIHTFVAGTLNGGTTPALDCTGKDLLVVGVTAYTGPGSAGTVPPVTDSQGNTWTALTQWKTTNRGVRLFYCANPTVGAAQTFTVSQSVSAPSIFVIGATGGHATPYDQESGATAASVTSAQPGSITPSVNDALLVTVAYNEDTSGTAISINSGFTLDDLTVEVPGATDGGASAHLIQTSAAAVNPTWDYTASQTDSVIAMASFKPSVSVGGGGPLINGGQLTSGGSIARGRVAVR